MGYRGNLGCLWILLALALIGGTPLMVGVARLLLAFVLFALVGGAIATWWIRKNAVIRYTSGQSEKHNRFVELLIGLLVKLADSDGTLEKSEVTAIRHFFQHDLGYDAERLIWVRDLIKESRRSTQTVEQLCDALRTGFRMQERFIVLQVLARVAEADGRVTPREMEFIERVSFLLGLDPFVQGFNFGPGQSSGRARGSAPRAPGASVDEALGVLGLSRGAGPDEVKAAWRKLSMENHPDRVSHLGDEFRELAEERMTKINAAYETLKQAGMAS